MLAVTLRYFPNMHSNNGCMLQPNWIIAQTHIETDRTLRTFTSGTNQDAKQSLKILFSSSILLYMLNDVFRFVGVWSEKLFSFTHLWKIEVHLLVKQRSKFVSAPKVHNKLPKRHQRETLERDSQEMHYYIRRASSGSVIRCWQPYNVTLAILQSATSIDTHDPYMHKNQTVDKVTDG